MVSQNQLNELEPESSSIQDLEESDVQIVETKIPEFSEDKPMIATQEPKLDSDFSVGVDPGFGHRNCDRNCFCMFIIRQNSDKIIEQSL